MLSLLKSIGFEASSSEEILWDGTNVVSEELDSDGGEREMGVGCVREHMDIGEVVDVWEGEIG
jgi:hypothetical protein